MSDEFKRLFPTITLSPEAWDKFIEAINDPPEPTEKLINLVRKYGRFAANARRAQSSTGISDVSV